MKKTTRTISGITPVAVMTQPMECPGHCVYCPTFSATPQSYTPESPAVLRARECLYAAGEQVALRLKTLTQMGHPTDKIELIIMGGTFPAAPVDYQYNFIKDCFDALNGQDSSSLKEAQHINETALHRCTGLCIETRPDFCGQKEIDRMLEYGATRVEIGVQMLSDSVYRTVKRGHTVEDVVRATNLLRENALKVHYHWMPGLPGSTPEEDLKLSKMLWDDPRFRPDGLKIYPTMVVEGTELEKWYREMTFQPYANDVMTDLIADIKAGVPKYVRISRVLRDIPSKYIVGGLRDSMRDPLRQLMERRGQSCQCIRCREYGFRIRDGWPVDEPHLSRLDYEAAGGTEIFLSFEDGLETLFGLLRLRIQEKSAPGLDVDVFGNVGLIRELHVFGPEVPLNQHNPSAAQHRGLGKALLREAERLAGDEFQCDWLAVLSGVGAREYYRSEGYQLQGAYMVKPVSDNPKIKDHIL
jgi:elongator complex protein 3